MTGPSYGIKHSGMRRVIWGRQPSSTSLRGARMEAGRPRWGTMNQRAAGGAGVTVAVGAANCGSGGARVGSQGREPLGREQLERQVPEGRQNIRPGEKAGLVRHNPTTWVWPIGRWCPYHACRSLSVLAGLCCSRMLSFRGSRPWLPTVVPSGLVHQHG